MNRISVLSYDAYPDEQPCIGVDIRKIIGEQVDFFSATNDEIDYFQLNDLYMSARRNALKIDEVISDILAHLK